MYNEWNMCISAESTATFYINKNTKKTVIFKIKFSKGSFQNLFSNYTKKYLLTYYYKKFINFIL